MSESNLLAPEALGLPRRQRSVLSPQDLAIPDVRTLTPASLGVPLQVDSNQFLLGIERGTYETGISLGSGLQMLGNMPGLGFVHSVGENLEEGSRARLDTIPLPKESDVTALWQRLQSGKAGANEALDWFAYSLGNAGPSMASSVAAGAIGTAAAGPVGGLVGMGGISYLLNAGEVYANLREQGHDSPGAAAVAGIPMALLDVVTPGRVFGKVVWRPTKLARGGVGQAFKEIGREAFTSFSTEALTETAQEAIGAGTESLVTGKDFFTPDTMARLLNAFAAGGLAGGVFGAGAQTISETGARFGRSKVGNLSEGQTLVENETLLGSVDDRQTSVDITQLTTDELAPRPTHDPTVPLVPQDVQIEQQEQQNIARRLEEQQELPKPTTPTLEELFTDPNSPVFRAPQGATPLTPTDDIFVVADDVDVKQRAREFNALYFDNLLDVENTDYEGHELERGVGGLYMHSGGAYQDLRVGKSAEREASGRKKKTYKAARSRLWLSSRLAMTPVQFDSILLHEMVHQAMAEQADSEQTKNGKTANLLRKDSQKHGPAFQKLIKAIADQANIPTATTHDVPVRAFQAQTIRRAQKAAQGTPQVIANKLVDTLITYWPGGLRPKQIAGRLISSPSETSAAYRARVLIDALRSKGVTGNKLEQLLSRRLSAANYQKLLSESERVKVLSRIQQSIAEIERQPSRVHPVVLLYTRAPDAAKQLYVAEQTAPEGTKIVLSEPDTGYDYAKAPDKSEYKIEATDAREVAEKMGHVIAENWLSLLSKEQRARLESRFAEQTRGLKDDAPTFGQWLLRNSGIEPALERLNKALRYHHAISDIRKPYETWLEETALETRIQLSSVSNNTTPEPGRATSDLEDTSQSLFNLFKHLENVPGDMDGADKGERDQLKNSLDKASWFHRNLLTLIQFAEQNKHIKALQEYLDGVRNFWADKTTFTSLATDRLNEWTRFGKDESRGISQYLLEQTILSDQKKRRLLPDERRALADKYKLSQDARAFVLQIDQDMQKVLGAMKQQMLLEVDERLNKDKDVEAAAKLRAQIEEEYSYLEQRNYFPMSRFGKHTLIVTARHSMKFAGRSFNKGDTVARFQYDRAVERQLDTDNIRARFPADKYNVASGIVEDTEFAFQGFPPSLVRSLETELELSEEQKRSLKEAFIRLAPGAGFMKHRLERRGIAGFSEDGVRVYADYMFHASNHFARLRHYRKLADTINTVKNQVREIIARGGNYTNRQRIHQYLNEHYRYLMNPSNEAAGLRSFIFKWYFLGNARQLLVNMTQVPLFTYGYLAAKYGDVTTGQTLGKTYSDIFRVRSNPSVLTQLESDLLARGVKAGFIDESFATEMAAQAHGDVLSRMRGASKISQSAQLISNYGLWPFKWSEGINRRVSYLAAIRLAQQQGGAGISSDELFQIGRDAVEKTQFEYARWARMPIARGGRLLGAAAPVLFMFQSYLQGTLYFYSTQPGRGRALVALLAAAGLMGLPGAEDVSDIIDFFVTKVGEKLGWKNPHADSKKWIRDNLTAANIAPDLVMHGASRYTMGLYGLNTFFGLPVPAIDLSSSLSLGRVIPGVESTFSLSASPRDRVAKAIERMGGVAGSLGVAWSRALFSNDFHDWQQAMPPVIRQVMMASRAAAEGAYTDRSGARLVPLDPQDNEHSAELLGVLLLGGQPTRLTQIREKNWAQAESRLYYLTRRELVLKDLAFATIAKDQEGKADALKAMRQYNASAPPGLKISPTDMKRSLESRIKNRALRERGLPPEKRFVPLYRQYEPGFPTIG